MIRFRIAYEGKSNIFEFGGRPKSNISRFDFIVRIGGLTFFF